jgi:hypothetical protein
VTITAMVEASLQPERVPLQAGGFLRKAVATVSFFGIATTSTAAWI